MQRGRGRGARGTGRASPPAALVGPDLSGCSYFGLRVAGRGGAARGSCGSRLVWTLVLRVASSGPRRRRPLLLWVQTCLDARTSGCEKRATAAPPAALVGPDLSGRSCLGLRVAGHGGAARCSCGSRLVWTLVLRVARSVQTSLDPPKPESCELFPCPVPRAPCPVPRSRAARRIPSLAVTFRASSRLTASARKLKLAAWSYH